MNYVLLKYELAYVSLWHSNFIFPSYAAKKASEGRMRLTWGNIWGLGSIPGDRNVSIITNGCVPINIL